MSRWAARRSWSRPRNNRRERQRQLRSRLSRWLFPLSGHPEAQKAFKKDDWNHFVIEAKGDHVVISINGTKVIDRTDPKFDKSGIIALQVHVGPAMEVRYKDIEIKSLD